jgi:lipopolysaccharide export system protein LptC
MKFGLPMVAVLLIVIVVVWPQLKPTDSRIRIGFGSVNAREAMDPGMINPRYFGIDEGNLPYSITADLAKNVTKNSGEVELEMPKADLTLKDGSWLVLTAQNGVYDREAKAMLLNGEVNLFHDSGYEIRTEKAVIDLDVGEASGTLPVVGHGPFGELRSEGFQLKDKGATVFFSGKAKLTIFPGFGASTQ